MSEPWFSVGTVKPYEQPRWLDDNCPDAVIRGRIATRQAYAAQAVPDSREYWNCLREVVRLEQVLDARERNRP